MPATADAGPTLDAPSVGRSPKGTRTRARLLESAKQVFKRDGYLDARIIDIGNGAGIAVGTFYHYFDSKEQIFREVAEAQEKRLTAPPDDVSPVPSARATTYDRIHRAYRRYLERYREDAASMGVIVPASRALRAEHQGSIDGEEVGNPRHVAVVEKVAAGASARRMP